MNSKNVGPLSLLLIAASTMYGLTPPAGWPSPKAPDVATPQAIVKAVYECISGAKGQPRDWTRFRSLFVPEGRLARTVPAADGKSTDLRNMSVEDFISQASPNMAANGFFEVGIHEQAENFGNIVHVFSTYESRHAMDDAKPFARGVNSIQLIKDGDRYWILTILWDSERPGLEIPAKYLPTH